LKTENDEKSTNNMTVGVQSNPQAKMCNANGCQQTQTCAKKNEQVELELKFGSLSAALNSAARQHVLRELSETNLSESQAKAELAYCEVSTIEI
jgi:hypothetical protein